MADRIRELEAAAGVPVVSDAMVERFSLAYRICEETHERTFTHNMGIKAALTAALHPERGQDTPPTPAPHGATVMTREALTERAERMADVCQMAQLLTVLPSPDLLTDGDWADLCAAVRALNTEAPETP